jgi:tRNA(Arg) A34 adenosine deaminase TadA
VKELTNEQVRSYLQQSIALATANAKSGKGGPFGVVIVCDDTVISTGVNTVTQDNDPTAHAEVNAIRAACKKIGNFTLADCILIASCEPCPMCLAAIYWARIGVLYYAATKDDASLAGFDDRMIWREMVTKPADRLIRMKRIEIPAASQPFKTWDQAEIKTPY